LHFWENILFATENQDGKVKVWDFARALLDLEAMGGADFVCDRITNYHAHLWIAPDQKAVAVTEVSDENRLHVWGAGGDLASLLPLLPSVEQFAAAMGCTALEVPALDGWRDILADLGFEQNGDEMVKATSVTVQ